MAAVGRGRTDTSGDICDGGFRAFLQDDAAGGVSGGDGAGRARGRLCALIAPFYPNPGKGRPPIGLERMLRCACIHFTAVDAATSNTSARDRAERPFSTAPINRPRKSRE